MGKIDQVSSPLSFLSIIIGTFILEDPTTVGVGTLIASSKISFVFGFSALVIGIFLGDLGLYGLGFLFKRKVFATTKQFYLPSDLQIGMARFLPGARTMTFLASGFEGYPLLKFILIIFPSSIVWTLLLLTFTDQVIAIFHILPSWLNWIVGLFLLVFISKIRTITKIMGMAALVLAVIIHHSILKALGKKKELPVSLSRYSRVALKILDVSLETTLKKSQVSGNLVLSNHMSYLDVICLSSVYSGFFITSVEIRETPVLGLICDLCGCLFTERRASLRTRERMDHEISEIEAVLKDGFSLTLFPEGTSSNGEKLLPFKTSLLEGAFRTKSSVRPVVLKYEEIKGKKFSPENRDVVCWYGKMGFTSHFLKLCDSQKIKATLYPLEILDPKNFLDRKQLGAQAHIAMSTQFEGLKCNLSASSNEQLMEGIL